MSRARLAARLSLVALTIACGSDSGIVEPTTLSAREAVHFDQLLGSACNNSNQAARCTFLTNFALPPAFGATPSPLEIDAGWGVAGEIGGGELGGADRQGLTWQGFILAIDSLDAQGAISARTLTLMTFSDSNVSSGILLSPGLRERLFDTTATELAIDSADYFEPNSVPGKCTKPPKLRYTTVPTLTASDFCETRTFMVVTTITFPGNKTVGIGAQAVNGIVLGYKKTP